MKRQVEMTVHTPTDRKDPRLQRCGVCMWWNVSNQDKQTYSNMSLKWIKTNRKGKKVLGRAVELLLSNGLGCGSGRLQ